MRDFQWGDTMPNAQRENVYVPIQNQNVLQVFSILHLI